MVVKLHEIKCERRVFGYVLYDPDSGVIKVLDNSAYKKFEAKSDSLYYSKRLDWLSTPACAKLDLFYPNFRQNVVALIEFETSDGNIHCCGLTFATPKNSKGLCNLYFMASSQVVNHGKDLGFKLYASKNSGFSCYIINNGVIDILFRDISVPRTYVYNLISTRDASLLQPFFKGRINVRWFEDGAKDCELVKNYIR